MESRSGRRRCPDGDRISGLPDHLLHEILVRLRCARAAAVTSALSRRWRGLWRGLPVLSFRYLAPDALHDALALVAPAELSVLDIIVPLAHWMSAAAVTSLLRAAAWLAPLELVVAVWGDTNHLDRLVELPCFYRATSVRLQLRTLRLATPAAGFELPAVERLSFTGCSFNIADVILGCPRLRVLEICCYQYRGIFTVHSTTIEELVVDSGWLNGIDISAPVLTRFSLKTKMGKDFSVSFLAPMVQSLSWHCISLLQNLGIGALWRLTELNMWLEGSVYGLALTIDVPHWMRQAEGSYMEQVAQFPKFSVLKLNLEETGHALGPVLLNVLGFCTAIRSLKIDMVQKAMVKACLLNCPCDQPEDWRSQSVSMTALEEIEITNFKGFKHEVDFMKLLFRCATVVERVSVKLSPMVLPSKKKREKIFAIFEENPSVKCYLYDSCGELVACA